MKIKINTAPIGKLGKRGQIVVLGPLTDKFRKTALKKYPQGTVFTIMGKRDGYVLRHENRTLVSLRTNDCDCLYSFSTYIALLEERNNSLEERNNSLNKHLESVQEKLADYEKLILKINALEIFKECVRLGIYG